MIAAEDIGRQILTYGERYVYAELHLKTRRSSLDLHSFLQFQTHHNLWFLQNLAGNQLINSWSQ